jgi:hypothetical protein
MAATWKKLAYADDVPALTLFDQAHVMLYSQAANVALGLVVSANSVVGRLSGNIVSLDGANIRSLANVEDGAQQCNATRVAAAGAVMESDFAANGDIMYSNGNTAAILGIGSNGEVLKVTAGLPAWEAESGGVAFPTTANAATRANTTAANGEGCFQLDTQEAYVCTVAG